MNKQEYAVWRDQNIARLLRQERYTLSDLRDVVVILRGEGGCPWDREQDHHSIRKGLIEECYEVIEAIDTDDPVLLREELGDVLLQIVFHADMEKDAGRFDLDDVANDECVKMISRHPHVFGTVQADTSEEVLRNWEAIKTEEKHRRSLGEQLRSIPPMLPALMRAQKAGRKAGLQESVDPATLLEDITVGLRQLPTAEKTEQDTILGKVLLDMTTLAGVLSLEAEECLSGAVERLITEIEANPH